MAYKKIESGMWLPEKEGDELEGEVLETQEGAFGRQYVIKQKDGSILLTPSHAVLLSRMISVQKGDKIKIVFTGEEPTDKGNPVKLYDVFRDE